MPTREDYLDYLSESGLSEDRVLPMLDAKKISPESFALLLQALGNEKIQGKDREAIETMARMIGEKWNTNKLLSKLHETLATELTEARLQVSTRAFPGVFPTNSFNAQCVPRNNGFLILLDTGCFEVLEAAVGVLVSKWQQSEKVEVFSSIISNYCEKRTLPDLDSFTPPGLGGRHPDSSRLGLMYPLVTSTEEFIMAHEHGHVINNHLEKSPSKSFRFNPTAESAEIEAVSKSREQEHEADLWAIRALIQRAQRKANDLDMLAVVCAGPLISLGTGLLVEEYRKRRGWYNDTHPPSGNRIYMVEAFYELLGIQQQAYIGRRFLELIGDCAVKILGESISIPLLDRELNKTFQRVLDTLKYDYEKPEWLTGFQ